MKWGSREDKICGEAPTACSDFRPVLARTRRARHGIAEADGGLGTQHLRSIVKYVHMSQASIDDGMRKFETGAAGVPSGGQSLDEESNTRLQRSRGFGALAKQAGSSA